MKEERCVERAREDEPMEKGKREKQAYNARMQTLRASKYGMYACEPMIPTRHG